MTLIYLLRHAESIANEKGILAGRSDVGLSKRGKNQALELSKALKELEIDRILVSPIPRCRETVLPFIASLAGKEIPIEVNENFQEMDYGNWSGRKLKLLSLKRDWRIIQKSPEKFSFPGGESFQDAWDRVLRGLNDLTRRYPKSKVLLISHGDIIKMALAQTLGTELKNFQKIHINPASLSAIELGKNDFVAFTNKTLVNSESGKRRKNPPKIGKFVLGGGRS
ncbi:MAG: histidine phosphatase family protein [Candidatus Nanopelagicaceae bacterium]